MKLSPNFDRSEFACSCGCGFDAVDVQLISLLETIRTYFNKPISINSGARCHVHNASVGGSERSQHLYGKAADIVVSGVNSRDVADYVERHFGDVRGGVGRYNSFTHVDVRDNPARWGS